jgi:hypothetical protein
MAVNLLWNCWGKKMRQPILAGAKQAYAILGTIGKKSRRFCGPGGIGLGTE